MKSVIPPVLTGFCLALLSTLSSAQSFNYSDFTSTTGLTLNGNAQQSGKSLRVCTNVKSDKGSVFYDQPVFVAGGFNTKITFQMSGYVSGGADGLALIIHNDPAGINYLGDHASAMGYGGFASSMGNAVDNALVIELDTFMGTGQNDPNNNHVSIHTGGTGDCSHDEAMSIGVATPSSTIKSGTHTLQVNYDGTLLQVYFDQGGLPVISVPWSFASGGTYLAGGSTGGLNLINGTDAYIGFSAACGGSAENHDLIDWTFTSNPVGPIGTNYCGPANLNSTGIPGSISAWGSTGAAANNVRLDVVSLPLNQFGMFITSQTQGFVPFPGGSQGNLCLGGAIGRYSKNLVNTGSSGQVSLQLDLTNTPTPSGPTSIQSGQTWNFQLWYRDKNPNTTSNFSDGLSVIFS